jgi:hypothetical protein
MTTTVLGMSHASTSSHLWSTDTHVTALRQQTQPHHEQHH